MQTCRSYRGHCSKLPRRPSANMPALSRRCASRLATGPYAHMLAPMRQAAITTPGSHLDTLSPRLMCTCATSLDSLYLCTPQDVTWRPPTWSPREGSPCAGISSKAATSNLPSYPSPSPGDPGLTPTGVLPSGTHATAAAPRTTQSTRYAAGLRGEALGDPYGG